MSIRAGRRSRIITTEPYNRMNKTNNRNNNNNANNNSNTTKVYVGNLPWDLTWQDLKDHMKTIGTVQNVDILTDRNGRSKGSAIVEYSRANDALQAIQQLHDSVLKGRPIQVREDRDAVRQDNRGNTNDKGDGNGGMTITIANDTNASTTTNTNTNNRNKNSNNKTVNTETVIGRHVYVGNLSWDVAWQDLKDHMKAAGNVLRADVMTESNGRSKGCGIVEYSTVEEAREAIATLNDTTLMNRLIFVREDRERANTTASSRRLYVGNLAWSVRWQDLKDHFKPIGTVTRADVAMENDGNRSKGYGLVEFGTEEEAAAAIEQLNDSYLHERQIFVREDREGKRL